LDFFEILRERVSTLLEMAVDMIALFGRKRMRFAQNQRGQKSVLAPIPNDGSPDFFNLGC